MATTAGSFYLYKVLLNLFFLIFSVSPLIIIKMLNNIKGQKHVTLPQRPVYINIALYFRGKIFKLVVLLCDDTCNTISVL